MLPVDLELFLDQKWVTRNQKELLLLIYLLNGVNCAVQKYLFFQNLSVWWFYKSKILTNAWNNLWVADRFSFHVWVIGVQVWLSENKGTDLTSSSDLTDWGGVRKSRQVLLNNTFQYWISSWLECLPLTILETHFLIFEGLISLNIVFMTLWITCIEWGTEMWW